MFEKQQWQAFHMQAASIGINSVERRKLEDSPVELVGFLLKTIQDRAPSPRTPSVPRKPRSSFGTHFLEFLLRFHCRFFGGAF